MRFIESSKKAFGKWGALAVVVAAVGYVACYNPDIQDNFLVCNVGGKACPDDFVCSPATNKCVKSTSGAGGSLGTGGTIGTGGAGGTGGAPMCVGPLPACKASTAPGQTCDPACQSGCQCTQRCGLVGAQAACIPDTKGTKALAQDCGGQGPNVIVDDCQPGLTCLPEYEEVCGKHCFRYCKDDTDCSSGAHCSVPLTVGDKETGVRVCDNPPENCVPVFGAGNCNRADRPSPAFGCYIMGGGYNDQAVCDCAGTLAEDALCQAERECKPGLVCIPPAAGEKPRCKRVCPQKMDEIAKTICGLTKACVPVNGSQRWGYCK
ncbi:MAG: hypothetical protein SF187_15040 [Deltaproteobacteria bacterium]|nr:hypothetical protein [Deltaproteobacteria bacterium]